MWFSIDRPASRYAIPLLLCSAVCVQTAAAQTADAKFITLDEAIARTLENNPQLRAFGYQLDVERGRVRQAGLAPNPELLVTIEDALGTGDYEGFDSAETTISLGWTFEHAVRERRVTAAQASESLAAADIEVLRVDVVAETARRFLTLMAYQARAVTADEAVNLAGRTVAAVQQRVEAGRSPEADLARSRAELAFTVLVQDDIGHELRTARHRLAAQWGATQPDFQGAQGDPYQLPATLPFQDLQTQARQNPEMARYLTQQRVDEAQLHLAEAQRKPGWIGQAGVRRYERTDDFALVTGFTIPLALRNRNEGKIAEAHAVMDQTLAESAAAQVNLDTSLYVFYEALQHSLHRARTLRTDVLPQIELALAETQAAYELGRYGYFEWRTVQAELIEAKNALIEASIDAHRNVIEIERLTGVRAVQAEAAP